MNRGIYCFTNFHRYVRAFVHTAIRKHVLETIFQQSRVVRNYDLNVLPCSTIREKLNLFRKLNRMAVFHYVLPHRLLSVRADLFHISYLRLNLFLFPITITKIVLQNLFQIAHIFSVLHNVPSAFPFHRTSAVTTKLFMYR